jgi:hypothetical protein
MPTLDDLPTLRTVTTVNGGDILPIYDIDSNGSTKVSALPVFGITGLQANDAATVASGVTISRRLTVVTGTTNTLTLPPASGNLRQVIVMNTGSGACTINRAGSDPIVSAQSQTATSIGPAAGTSAILLSDGTKWYHISNDVAS